MCRVGGKPGWSVVLDPSTAWMCSNSCLSESINIKSGALHEQCQTNDGVAGKKALLFCIPMATCLLVSG